MQNLYPIQAKPLNIPGQTQRTAIQVEIRCVQFVPFTGATALVRFLDADDQEIYACNTDLTDAQFAAWGADDSAFIDAAAANVGAVIL